MILSLTKYESILLSVCIDDLILQYEDMIAHPIKGNGGAAINKEQLALLKNIERKLYDIISI